MFQLFESLFSLNSTCQVKKGEGGWVEVVGGGGAEGKKREKL